MTAKKPRVVWVVECEGCGYIECAERRKVDAERACKAYPVAVSCTGCPEDGRNVVRKYIEAPKARRAKG